MCKYTLDPVYVDSSNLLTFNAIDETYVRKSYLEEHTHFISAIVDLQTTLDGKADKEHTHEISDVINLQTSLDNKTDKEHTHTKSEITDLTISDSIYGDSYTASVTEGTEYLTLTYKLGGSFSGGGTFTFTINDNFDAEKFSKFNVSFYNSDGNILVAVKNFTYDSKFNESGVSSETYGRSLSYDGKENYIEIEISKLTGVIPITATITDLLNNVLCKYTVSQSEVDSSTVITFGVIDEMHARKTELEEELDSLKSELIDLFYPVGICIKLANGVSVPSTGTWELVGIYGPYSYTENSITHYVDFLGKSIIDTVKTDVTVSSGNYATWTYNSLLENSNYTITTIFGSYLNEEDPISGTSYYIDANLSNGTDTYNIQTHSNQIMITPKDDGYGMYCQIRAVIKDPSKVSISDDNLSFEYQRTA